MAVSVSDNFGAALESLSEKFGNELDRAMKISALQIRDKVAAGISSQKWNWENLNEKYSLFKKNHHGSSKILISGIRLGKNLVPTNYRNSFSYQQIKPGVWTVGTNHIQGRSMEFGDEERKIPARPHLEPTLLEYKETYMENVMNALKRSLK